MSRAPSHNVRSLILAVVVAGAFFQGCDRNTEPAPLVHVPTAQLPGTEATNAGKAIRTRFEQIETREGVRGFDLFWIVREDPMRFAADVSAIHAAAAPDECDWGVPLAWGYELPHVVAHHAFVLILLADAQAAVERLEPDIAARNIATAFRLARHAASGGAVVDRSVAARHVMKASTLALDLASEGLFSPDHAAAILDQIAWIQGEDPFGIRDAIIQEGDVLADALRDGKIANQHFVTSAGEKVGLGRRIGRRIAGPIGQAVHDIAAAWDEPDYEARHDAAILAADAQTGGYGWLIPSYARSNQEIGATLTNVAALRATLIAIQDQTTNQQ